MTKSVLTMGQATIAYLWNNRNSRWQAMSDTPEERKKGRKFYAPSHSFDVLKIKIAPKTHKKLTETNKTLLPSLEMK